MTRRESSTLVGAGDDHSVAQTVERLDREFCGSVHRNVIVTVVRRSRRELDSPSAGALPELLERLARQRLLLATAPRWGCAAHPAGGRPNGG